MGKWTNVDIKILTDNYLKGIDYIDNLLPHKSRGTIYLKMRRMGLLKRVKPIFTSDKERFLSKINKDSGIFGDSDNHPTECWEWMGCCDKDNYGLFKLKNKMIKAHRHAWKLKYGAIPNNLFVCHKCDNPRCVRPGHLFLGTNQDNMNDKCKKKRAARGENNGNAKLLKNEVQEIRKYYKNKIYSINQLSVLYKVSSSTIYNIINYKNWDF